MSKTEENLEVEEQPQGLLNQLRSSNVTAWNIFLAACNLALPLFLGQNIGLISYDTNVQLFFVEKHGFTGTRVPNVNWAIVNAMFPVFGMAGSLSMSWAVSKYGRKYTSILCISIGILGEIFLIISYYVGRLELLGVSRALVGFSGAGGMVTSVSLMFELLPLCYKTIFNPLVQVSINLGIFISGILTLNGVTGSNWQYISIPPLVVSLLYLAVLLYMPEAPVYFIVKNNDKQARASLKKVRKSHDAKLERELTKMIEQNRSMEGSANLTAAEIFKSPTLIRPLLICMFIHMSQQISGINAVIAYVGSFFIDANFDQPDLASVIVFILALVGSMIFSPMVAKLPRKWLLVTGHVGMCAAFIVGYVSWLLDASAIIRIVALCIYVFVFQIGPGLLVWIITFEIFPPNAAGAAQGLCTGANWISNTLVYILYPIVEGSIGFHVSAIFIGINFAIFVIMSFILVETLNRTPTEVVNEFKKKFG